MKDPYVSCYFSGRCDEYDGDIDIDKLVEKIHAGSPMRDVTLEAAKRAITADMDVATKAAWLKDNVDEIKALGGDSEKAWRLYSQGRTDALAQGLEVEILEAIVEEEPDEEDEEDEEDDDEDEDSDDDEDEDEDEEEDK